MLSFMALNEQSEALLNLKQNQSKSVLKYYKNEEHSNSTIEVKEGMQRVDSFLLHADNIVSAGRPAALNKTSDFTFKFRLLERLLENKVEKARILALNKRFYVWKLASKCFGEQLL